MEKALQEQFDAYYMRLVGAGGIRNFFTIQNTTKRIDRFYFTPIRLFSSVQACGVVVSNALEAKHFARIADGHFDYIAVDSEKKIEPDRYAYQGDLGNIKGEVQDIVRKSKLVTFKTNDVTVNAIDIFLSDRAMDFSPAHIAIIGTGNIGFKLALRLVERGYWVRMFRRNQEKLNMQVDCINLVKPKGTLANAQACSSVTEALAGVKVIVAATDSSDSVTLDDLQCATSDPLLIDCGKGCFTQDVCAAHMVYRTDVGAALIYQLKMIVASIETLHPKFGRKRVGDKIYVCGVSGLRGEIVVHDINHVDSVIGICNGEGGLITS